jgi:hypothetical protein
MDRHGIKGTTSEEKDDKAGVSEQIEITSPWKSGGSEIR